MKYIPEKYRRGGGGVKLNIKENPLKLKLFSDQFHPYKIQPFDLDLSYRPAGREFPGTVFRLPMRGEEGSRISDISRNVYSAKDFPRLAENFLSNKFHYMLFLNSVENISLLQGDSKAELETVAEIGKTTVILTNSALKPGEGNTIISQKFRGSSKQSEVHFLVSQRKAESTSNAAMLASSAMGREHGLNSNVAVALPLSYNVQSKKYEPEDMRSGDLFTFLPLNIKTSVNFHINGGFALSSNRKTLWQDDGRGSKEDIRVQWNELLMKEEVPKAVLSLLKEVKANQDIVTGSFDTLWPHTDHVGSSISREFIAGFYQMIARSQDELFYSEFTKTWLNFESCYFANFEEIEPGLRGLFHKILLTHLKEEVDDRAELVNLKTSTLDGIILAAGKEAVMSRCFSATRFYKEAFLPRIAQIKEEERDQVMAHLLNRPLLDAGVKEALKSTGCIKTSHTKRLMMPGDLVHPVDSITNLFLKEEDLFPHDLYHNSLPALIGLGMKSTVDTQILVNRAQFLDNKKETFSGGDEKLKRLASYLLKAVRSKWTYDKNPAWISQLSEYHWLESTKSTLCRADQLWTQGVALFVSYTREIVKPLEGFFSSSDDFFKALGVRDKVSTEDLVNQLVGLYNDFPEKDTGSKREDHYRRFIEQNLDLLGGRLDMKDCIHPLVDLPLYYDPATDTLHQMKNVSLDTSLPLDLNPYLVTCKKYTSKRSMQNIMLALGAKEHLSSGDLLGVLSSIKETQGDKALEGKDLSRVVSILSLVVTLRDNEDLGGTPLAVFAPNEEGVLAEARTLSYNDAPWMKIEHFKGTFIHRDVPRDHAGKLGVKMVKCEALELFASKDFPFGDPYGQAEKLTTRIKNILDEYPGNIDIFKEMIQNADDAGAGEIHFILDERSHRTERVFNNQSRHMQGPALCVYNNKNFEPADYEGLQNLGIGSKRTSEETIGKFGIGFNTVYSITDTPMFVSNNDLVILDPHRKFVPCAEVGNPGGKFQLSPDFVSSYSDIVDTFNLGDTVDMNPGTLFRLPLRSNFQSEIAGSESSGLNEVKARLDQFVTAAKDILLFLKNISCIKVSHVDATGTMTETAKFSSEREVFQSENESSTIYDMRLESKTNKNSSADIDEFKVAKSSAVDPLSGRKAEGAVAINMKHFETGEKLNGMIYVGLPLKQSSLQPVHIHGNFALDRGRNGLLAGSSWNKVVMSTAVSSAYLQLLESVRNHLQAEQTKREESWTK